VLRLVPLSLLLTILLGCGGASLEQPPTNINLVQTLTILPTPKGLDQSNVVRRADVASVQATFAGVAKAESVAVYKDLGFKDAAIREWSGNDGAHVLAMISRWPDRQTATNVGAGPVNLLLDTSNAAAWTPRELPGTRGARLTAPGKPNIKLLAFAVAEVSLVVRGDGPVTDAAMIRTMELLIAPVRAKAPR
jgi:hypothetical protein